MVVAEVVHMAPHQENLGLNVLGGHLVLHARSLILLQRLSNLLSYRCSWALHLSLLGSPCTAAWDSREGQSCKRWGRGTIFLLSQSIDVDIYRCLYLYPPTHAFHFFSTPEVSAKCFYSASKISLSCNLPENKQCSDILWAAICAWSVCAICSSPPNIWF